MTRRHWLTLAVALFVAGVYWLATLPVTDPAIQLAAGWGALIAGIGCGLRAWPEEVEP